MNQQVAHGRCARSTELCKARLSKGRAAPPRRDPEARVWPALQGGEHSWRWTRQAHACVSVWPWVPSPESTPGCPCPPCSTGGYQLRQRRPLSVNKLSAFLLRTRARWQETQGERSGGAQCTLLPADRMEPSSWPPHCRDWVVHTPLTSLGPTPRFAGGPGLRGTVLRGTLA